MRGYKATVVSAAVLALGLAACRTTPGVAPQAAAAKIADRLRAGDTQAAAVEFGVVHDSERHREAVFAVVYKRAEDAYARGDYETAARMLRFLVARYPRAVAPREALLYTLFLRRAQRGAPGPESAEMEALAAALAARKQRAPVWVALVETQTAIDRGRYEEARAALRRFRARWDGRPESLKDYVGELERFLATHGKESGP